MKQNRRNFIKTTGVSVGGALLLSACGKKVQGNYRFFTDAEALTVIELCEQIIPADKDPGATDAGVIHYIDKQLTAYFQDLQPIYREGIVALNASCMELHSCRFEALAFAEQTAFLKKMENGKVPGKQWNPADQKNFFSTLVSHSMQGFYGSPRHGGNRNYVSYTMMGIEYPLIIGQNRYKGFDI
jgi:gluconate 2-dehydrogenase gamma chain